MNKEFDGAGKSQFNAEAVKCSSNKDSLLEKIKNYYEKAPLWLPKFPNFRIWKFRLQDGRMIKIKQNLKSKNELRKALIKYLPADVYYSSGCFLAPSKVKGNKKSSVLLFRNIPFDLDSDEPHGREELDIVRESTVSLIKDLEYKFEVKPFYILYTGRGFQVVYEFSDLEQDKLREMNIGGIDQDITFDKYRVIRLPQTINSKTGRVTTFLTIEELKKGIDYILSKSKIVYNPTGNGDRAGRRLAGTSCESMTNFSRAKAKEEESAICPVRTSSNYKYREVSNEVKGEKRFIPVLKYKYKEISFSPKEDLRRLAEKYGLNEWFLIKTEEELCCISLACFDKRRLEKIINSSRSELSKNEFSKFKKIFIRTSPIMKNSELTDIPFALGIASFDYPSKQFQYSKPHLDLLKFFKFAHNPANNYIGYNKPRMLEVTKR